MKTRAEEEGEGKRRTWERGEEKEERRRGKGKEAHRLSRSQSVACAAVQACAFKALAGLAPSKKLAQRFDSLVCVS